MKKFIFTLISLLVLTLSASAINKDDLQGQWKLDNCLLTFKADTLFIDELDNEGFEYTYKQYGDTLVVIDNVCGDYFTITVVLLDKKSIELYYNDDSKHKYVFYKTYMKNPLDK